MPPLYQGAEAVLYLRSSVVEDDAGDPNNVAAQEAALRAFAAREGWTVVAVFRDLDLKGWMGLDKRTGLADALAYCERHRPAVLAFFDLSRFARDIVLQETFWRRLEACGTRPVSLHEPHVTDPLVRGVLGLIAEQDRRTKRTYSLAAHRLRTARGGWLGRVSLGYVAGPDGRLAPEGGERQATAEEIFRRFGDGEPVVAICQDLNRRAVATPAGGGMWEKSTVLKLLRNPAYRGTVRTRHHATEGAHPVFVPADVLARVDARLAALAGGKRGPRRKAASSWCEGRIVHACGKPMYLVAPGPGRHPQFRCAGMVSSTGDRCRRPGATISARVCERLALEALRDLLYRLHAVTIDRAIRAATEAAPERGATRAMLERRIAEGRARVQRVATMALRNDLSDAWLDHRTAEIRAEIAAAEALLADLGEGPPDRAALAATLAVLREVRVEDLDAAGLALVLDRVGTLVVAGRRLVELRPGPDVAALAG